MVDSRDQIEDIVVIPEAAEHYLNQRQLEDYRDHRVPLIKWLCAERVEPVTARECLTNALDNPGDHRSVVPLAE